MNKIRLIAAALLVLGAAAQAAPGDVNLDGSSKTPKKPTLAATAERQLRRNDVPSVRTDPVAADVKTQADADMAARDARAKGPRLQVQRQNLKNGDAAAAMRRNATPNSIDHATAYGDIEHTEQVTDLKITLKK